MIESVDVIFANKLRYLRLMKNMKQEQLAIKMGMSQQVYSNFENGKTHFADEVIKLVSEAFDMKPSEFVKSVDNVNISNSPNSNSQYSTNNSSVNDAKVIEESYETPSAFN
jgi:transcriptional regulator with XRE-family HTH domain